VTPGTYHVLAIADSALTVLEHDENNNVLVMPGTVVVQ
jgi:subtilase family serine protease